MAESPATTGERPRSKTREQIVSEAARIEEDVLVSSKRHYITAAFWNRFHFWLGLSLVVVSAVAGASFIARFDGSGIVTGVLSLVVVVLSAVSTFVNGSERSTIHHSAGASYDALHNKVRIFGKIECSKIAENAMAESVDDDSLAAKLEDLSDQKARLNTNSPPTPGFAFHRARKAIEDGEADHVVDVNVKPADSSPQ